MTGSSLPSFVALQPMQRENGYVFTIEPHHCVGPEQSMFLFGGTTLAAGIAALETTCERPTVWTGAQYLGPAHPGDELRLTVDVLHEGKGLRSPKRSLARRRARLQDSLRPRGRGVKTAGSNGGNLRMSLRRTICRADGIVGWVMGCTRRWA